MSSKRTRHRRPPAPPPSDPVQDEVDDLAEELAVLWRSMPYALARDSAGQMSGDRHASGASSGSAATVNMQVVEAMALVETGLNKTAAEASRILNLERPLLDPVLVIAALPDWHRNLANRGQPLARYLRTDLGRWVSMARGAIGSRRRDELLGMDCPDHRDAPTRLRVLGDTARFASSLLAGPPPHGRLLLGPLCTRSDECVHDSCEWIRTRRLFAEHCLTDWLLSPRGAPVWLSIDGEAAFRWEKSKTIRCPKCKRQWAKTNERRMLARELAALGDVRPGDAAMLT